MSKVVALIYDFDGTLSPRNMQEFGFMRAVGVEDEEAFWAECDRMSDENNANGILCVMRQMVDKSRAVHKPISRQAFVDYGKSIELFSGVEEWFGKINVIGERLGLEIRHYINSSGLKEMIEGSKIAGEFEEIYASSFLYDENGVAVWPATAVDFTGKTQILWMINKGVEKTCDAEEINRVMPERERPVPFENMIYFGDGETDVPCMQIIKRLGGHSLAIYNPEKAAKRELAERLCREGRVQAALPADYREGGVLMERVERILESIADME